MITDSISGKFSEGGINQLNISSKKYFLEYFDIFTTFTSALNLLLKKSASSPMVRPYLEGSVSVPTKDLNSSFSTGPLISAEFKGFGLSST